MNTIEAVKKALEEAEGMLKRIKRKSSIPTLSRAAKALGRSNIAIKRHMSSGREQDIRWATAWDNARKKYISLDKELCKNGFYIDEIVSLENDVADLKNTLRVMER